MRFYLIHIILFLLPLMLVCQSNQSGTFIVKGTVKGKENREPIEGVDVYVVGGPSTKTDFLGTFSIRVRVGDELVFRSPELETRNYIIRDDEEIDVLVQGYQSTSLSRSKRASGINREHKKFIDSAAYYKKRNIDKSIDFIEKSLTVLGKRSDKGKTSLSFSTLGDIYLHWKQYDLAISNYKSAINAKSSVQVRIQLGEAYLLNGQFEESKKVFEDLKKERKLTAFQEIKILEGLGDSFNRLNESTKAISNYNEALKIAKTNLVTPKITDLNSKLGEVYAKTNNKVAAGNLFKNSLNLAKKENLKRSIQEKSKVADFYNKESEYDKEIELRKSTLEEVKKLKEDEEDDIEEGETKVVKGVKTITDSITQQRINYKIANAFIAQDKYEEAIPYLEESITKAGEEEDLVVKKDATRKISEAYKTIGDYTKALESYQDYVQLVDQLYIRKEQEISQLTRFSRDIALKQNRITSLETDRELSESKYDLALKDQELIRGSNKQQQIIIYSLIFGIVMLTLVAFLFYRTNKQQKFANNLLALKSLRSQMNPHFIFNALNSVNNFIARNDERSANRYLSEFSMLMRSVLENSEEDFIPLQKEIELLELYTKLEHSRFTEKFDYEIEIDKNVAIETFEIPPMLLQPYVENAIWHGLRYKEEKGWLKIQLSQPSDEELTISVSDNGVGRKQSAAMKTEHQRKQKSKGMGNIKKRIAILNDMYKDRVDVIISNMFEDETGTKVILTLKKD